MAFRHYDRDRLAGVMHDVVLHRKKLSPGAGAVGGWPTPSSTATMAGILASSAPGWSVTGLAIRRSSLRWHARIGLWHGYPEDFRYLMLNGMRVDRS